MKHLIAIAALAMIAGFGSTVTAPAQETEDPFADVVETRHGLMFQMAADLGTLGGMAKGDMAYDSAAAAKAASNIAAIASVISMAQFPEGSEFGKAKDSFALPAIWTNQEDFLVKIAALNTAAAALQVSAAVDVEGIKAGMKDLGGACSACHKDYRQKEE